MDGTANPANTTRPNPRENFPDYSEGMIKIRQLRLQAHEALLKIYCLNEIDVHQDA